MLDIKNDNLFIVDSTMSIYGVKRVLDFYDLSGKTMLVISELILPTLKGIKFTKSSLSNILETKLFRVDLLVVECDKDILTTLSIIRKVTNLPIIAVAYNYNDSRVIGHFEMVYNFRRKFGEKTIGKWQVTISSPVDYSDQVKYMLDDDYSNIDDIYQSKIRDLKIDNLFEDES